MNRTSAMNLLQMQPDTEVQERVANLRGWRILENATD
jgi:hypothetical protein